jgi:hypothetical protein
MSEEERRSNVVCHRDVLYVGRREAKQCSVTETCWMSEEERRSSVVSQRRVVCLKKRDGAL